MTKTKPTVGALQGSKAQGSTGVRPWSANLLSVQQAQSKGLRQPLKNLEAQKYFEIPELIQYLRILGCSKLYKHYKKKKKNIMYILNHLSGKTTLSGKDAEEI